MFLRLADDPRVQASDLVGRLAAWLGFEYAGAGGRGVDELDAVSDPDRGDLQFAGSERVLGLVGDCAAGRRADEDGDGSGSGEHGDVVREDDGAKVEDRRSAGDEDEVRGPCRGERGLFRVRGGVDEGELWPGGVRGRSRARRRGRPVVPV